MAATLKILHVTADPLCEPQRGRRIALINALGGQVMHAVAAPGGVADAIRQGISQGISVDRLTDFPSLGGSPMPGKLQQLARAMQGYDLVLTHDWGAINAALAHAVFRDQMQLPPLVHHEDALDAVEQQGARRVRGWMRRVALWRGSALVVSTPRIEAMALGAWQQSRNRVRLVRQGVVLPAKVQRVKPDALPRLIKRKGELWLGAIASDDIGAKAQPLLRAFSSLAEEWQIVLAGAEEPREEIMAEAFQLGVADKVHFAGADVDRLKLLGLLDVMVLLGNQPRDVTLALEAMSTALPVCSLASGDAVDCLSDANRSLLSDEKEALGRLADLPLLRKEIGAANRKHVERFHNREAEIAALRNIYAAALGKQAIP